MLATALEWAAAVPEVRRAGQHRAGQRGLLRAIEPFGFEHVGEQWDEEDGRELLFERRLR